MFDGDGTLIGFRVLLAEWHDGRVCQNQRCVAWIGGVPQRPARFQARHEASLERGESGKHINGEGGSVLKGTALGTLESPFLSACASTIGPNEIIGTRLEQLGPEPAAASGFFRFPRTRFYSERMATIGRTDAARRAGARLARTATSIAIAAPTTYASVSTLLSGMPMFSPLRRMRAAVRMSPTATPGVGELHDIKQDHAQHARARGAQRDPHGDLASARRDHQSDDAVDSKRRQHQDHAASDARDRRLHQEVVACCFAGARRR